MAVHPVEKYLKDLNEIHPTDGRGHSQGRIHHSPLSRIDTSSPTRHNQAWFGWPATAQ